MKDKVSIIIPFLNEADNIPYLLERLSDYFGKEHPYNAEVIFVDDGSTDNSFELLRNSLSKNYTSKIILLARNFGSHAALRAGMVHAEGRYTCFMYADLQDPLELIDRMYNTLAAGAEVCWASREVTDNSMRQSIFSRVYAMLMRKYAVYNYPQRGFDIVMFGTKVLKCLNANIEANSSVFLQILQLGFRQATISYAKNRRIRGVSKWTLAKKLKLFVDSFVAFSYFPIRFVTVAGIILFLLGVGWTIYIIFRKMIWNDLETGWPALVSLLTLGFGVTNISLGIIAEYLWRTLDSSRKRPVFIISEVIENNIAGNV